MDNWNSGEDIQRYTAVESRRLGSLGRLENDGEKPKEGRKGDRGCARLHAR